MGTYKDSCMDRLGQLYGQTRPVVRCNWTDRETSTGWDFHFNAQLSLSLWFREYLVENHKISHFLAVFFFWYTTLYQQTIKMRDIIVVNPSCLLLQWLISSCFHKANIHLDIKHLILPIWGVYIYWAGLEHWNGLLYWQILHILWLVKLIYTG